MQARRSGELQGPFVGSGQGAARGDASDRRALMHDYDIENQFELGDLAEDSDEGARSKRTSLDDDQRMHGRLSGAGRGRVQKESVQPKRNSLLR
jgi:hypothetical protein